MVCIQGGVKDNERCFGVGRWYIYRYGIVIEDMQAIDYTRFFAREVIICFGLKEENVTFGFLYNLKTENI